MEVSLGHLLALLVRLRSVDLVRRAVQIVLTLLSDALLTDGIHWIHGILRQHIQIRHQAIGILLDLVAGLLRELLLTCLVGCRAVAHAVRPG